MQAFIYMFLVSIYITIFDKKCKLVILMTLVILNYQLVILGNS